MKKLILLTGLFLSLNFTFAQTVKQNVERDFIEYSRLVSENKIEEALEYTNPKFFELIPKEKVKNLMEAVFNMPNIEYKIYSPKILEISDVKRINNIDYVKIITISSIDMKFTNIDSSDKSKLLLIQNSFESKFGKGHVVYDKASGFFKIKTNKEIIASSTDDQNNWKFVIIDNPRMKALLEKIVPAELLD